MAKSGDRFTAVGNLPRGPCEISNPLDAVDRLLRGVTVASSERLSVNPRGLADEYRKVFGAFLEQYQKGCAGMNIDYRLVRTDQALETFVRAYLEERRRLSR